MEGEVYLDLADDKPIRLGHLLTMTRLSHFNCVLRMDLDSILVVDFGFDWPVARVLLQEYGLEQKIGNSFILVLACGDEVYEAFGTFCLQNLIAII